MAKARLFTELLPKDGTAVFNIDARETARLSMLCRARGQRIITYGRNPAADLWLVEAQPEGLSQRLKFSGFGEKRDIVVPLIGAFQAYNALAAACLAIATGAPVRRGARCHRRSDRRARPHAANRRRGQ